MWKRLITRYQNLKMVRKLIIVFLVVIILPEIALGIYASYFSGYSIKTEVMKSTQETVNQINDNIDNEMDAVLNISAQIASEAKVKMILDEPRPQDIKQRFDNHSYMNTLLNDSFSAIFPVENVFMFSFNGEVYEADKNNLSLRTDYDFTRSDWYQDMKRRELRTLIMSDYQTQAFVEGSLSQKLFSVVRKIYDQEGQKEVGCMMILLNCDMLGNLLQNVNNGEGQSVLVIDNNKKIVYHPDSRTIGTQFRSQYISQLLQSRGGYLEDQDEHQFIAYDTSEVTGWVVIYQLDAASVLKNISRMRILIFLVTVLCIFVSVYFAAGVSRSISDPIAELQKQMKQVGKGDFDIDMSSETEDEIGHLKAAFEKMVKRTKQLIENVYQSEIYQKEAELNALQAQINPHFLYNTLQTIDMMAEEEGADDISEACQALSKVFRYAINRGQEYVALSEEITHIRNYMIIQKLRFGAKVDIIYDIQPECNELRIVKLLVQPLIENAIVHGMENSIGKCTLKVRAYRTDTRLYIEVEDDGEGIGREQLAKLNQKLAGYSHDNIIHQVNYSGTHESIGLDNTNARIKLYFGEEFGVSLTSEKGTLVKLTLPVKTA